MRIGILALLLCLSAMPVGAVDAYLCEADSATGFVYDKAAKTWRSTSVEADTRYVVRRSAYTRQGWELKHLRRDNTDVILASCEHGFDFLGNLECRGFFEFRMNQRGLRFILADLGGYWKSSNAQDDAQESMPFIAIGTCTPL